MLKNNQLSCIIFKIFTNNLLHDNHYLIYLYCLHLLKHASISLQTHPIQTSAETLIQNNLKKEKISSWLEEDVLYEPIWTVYLSLALGQILLRLALLSSVYAVGKMYNFDIEVIYINYWFFCNHD